MTYFGESLLPGCSPPCNQVEPFVALSSDSKWNPVDDEFVELDFEAGIDIALRTMFIPLHCIN